MDIALRVLSHILIYHEQRAREQGHPYSPAYSSVTKCPQAKNSGTSESRSQLALDCHLPQAPSLGEVSQPVAGSERVSHREGIKTAPGLSRSTPEPTWKGHHRLTWNPSYQCWGYELPKCQFIKGLCDELAFLNQCPYSPLLNAVLFRPGHHFLISLHLLQPPPLI